MKLKNLRVFEEKVEILLQDIHQHYGYDFRGYARASIYRRISRFLTNKKLQDIEALSVIIMKDNDYFERFLQEITVNVTEMFRDATFFLSLRTNILPILSTYPHIKIWDAGCSSGEELFSLAIILEEEGLLQKSKIYATDINQKVLKEAKEGIYPAANIPGFTAGYVAAGGKKEFSNYYQSNYGSLKFKTSLIKNVILYPHNLATDSSFNEFHLIICRNVLIYFNRELQERVFQLFDESLISLGYLGLGKKESLYTSSINKNFIFVDKENRLYRKMH